MLTHKNNMFLKQTNIHFFSVFYKDKIPYKQNIWHTKNHPLLNDAPFLSYHPTQECHNQPEPHLGFDVFHRNNGLLKHYPTYLILYFSGI